VGDTTRSGEAARMIIAPLLGRDRAGRKPLYTCTTSTASAFRPCALVEDNGVFTMVIVNDGVISSLTGSKAPQWLSTSVSISSLVSTLALSGSPVGAFRIAC
jgi:hypothetical protein